MSTPTLRQLQGPAHTRIYSYGAARGENFVPNDDLVGPIDSSDEWIRQRTGIEERRWADAGTSVVDMAEAASKEALERAGLAPTDVDAVILATVSHPYQTPAAAAILTDRLGATPAAAWDVSAGCAGFCHALAQASDLVRGGTARNVLVVGAEKLTDFTDITDRSTAFLFADGAGAVVVGPSETPGIGPTVWGSDGAQWEAIKNKQSWTEVRDAQAAGGEAVWPALVQEGRSVFRWAVWQMAPVAQKAIDASGVAVEELSAFIPHQANMRIIDEFAKQLGLPESVVIGRDIATTGNTSAASIPLATHRLLDEHPELSGGLALQIGFGAGLVFGAQVVVLP